MAWALDRLTERVTRRACCWAAQSTTAATSRSPSPCPRAGGATQHGDQFDVAFPVGGGAADLGDAPPVDDGDEVEGDVVEAGPPPLLGVPVALPAGQLRAEGGGRLAQRMKSDLSPQPPLVG